MNVIFSLIVVTIINFILPHLSMCQCIDRLFTLIFVRTIAFMSAVLMQGTHSVREYIYLFVKMQTKDVSIDIIYLYIISQETDIAKTYLMEYWLS